jgi:hypothetical protein
MKLNEHANKLLTNVTEAVTQNFGIGDASVVIEILRNRLYENKVQTLVQEYICNARDAMREVGRGNNFEVTVPTLLNPVFKVRDFGPGVNPDRMVNVFILYGASTKRGDNSQTGGFGIGAKSAWSYTDSFTIVTFVDGTKRSYIAHTGVNNNGRLDLISTEATKEPNGTEIQVAVRHSDIRQFKDAILRATYFWEKRPDLKGQLDVPELVRGYRIGSTLENIERELLPEYVRPNYYTEGHLAVIDGIPYPLGSKLMDKCKSLSKLHEFVHRCIILHIETGVVEVSASRESIADSPKTIDNLDKLAQKVALEVKTHIADRFGKVKSASEYIQLYKDLVRYYSIGASFAKYGTYRIGDNSILGDTLKKVQITYVTCLGRRGITKRILAEPDRRIKLELFDSTFFLTKNDTMIAQNKRIREHFLKNKEMLIIEILPAYTEGPVTNHRPAGTLADVEKVVKDLGIKDFTSLPYTVVPKEQKVKVTRDQKEFCLHVLGGDRHKYVTLASNTEKWLYVPLSDNGWKIDHSLDYIKELHYFMRKTHNMQICGVSERALKMVKGNANFIPLLDWLEKYKPAAKEIAYAQKQKATNYSFINNIEEAKGIKDIKLVALIEKYKSIEKMAGGTLPAILLKKVNQIKEVKDFEVQDSEVKMLVRTLYPLLTEFDNYTTLKNVDEMVVYLNAKYSK